MRYLNNRLDAHVHGNSIQLHVYTCTFTPFSFDLKIKNEINRIHHGWSVEIGKSQPLGPPVPVGNEARRVSHRNGGPKGWDFPFSTDHP